MTDDSNRPDDVVEGFDLPGGEATPPPEDETQAEEMGEFDMPGGEDVAPPEAAPSTELAEGFDLPGGEAVPPPEPTPGGGPRRTAGGQRPSVMGKFIALIVIPAVAIPIVFFVLSKKKEEAESYKEDYVQTAQEYLRLLWESKEAGDTEAGANLFVKARGLLSEKMLKEMRKKDVDLKDLDDQFREAAADLGAFVELTDLAWDEPASGRPYDTFGASAKFEDGAVPVRFRLGGAGKTIRIRAYSLGAAKRSRAERQTFPYQREYTAAASKFLKTLSDGSADTAHGMLAKSLADTVDSTKLAADFAEAAGGLGAFKSLDGVAWDPVVGSQSASFRARAVFEKGSTEVWFRVRGMMSIQIAKYRFGKKTK